MRYAYLNILLIFVLFTFTVAAQEKSPVKFGKVSAEDLQPKMYPVDTSGGAVIIADIGSSVFEGNSDGWFSLVYKHHRRVKILNRNGFDLANVEIPLYTSTDGKREEKLDKLKAYTYNLQNGKVVETKLSDDAIFKEKKSKNTVIKKFTMPAVQPGCIIEYSYTINSDFLFNLQPWNFQGSYPRLWSEYEVEMPSFFEYVSMLQGYQGFDIKTSKASSVSYRVRVPADNAWNKDEMVTLNEEANNFRWVMKNVPPLKEEKFTSSLDNYISRIEFQMSGQKFPNQPRKDIMGNWFTAGEDLLANEDFGAGLGMPNNWLDKELEMITIGSNDDYTKALKIYDYVQGNVKNLGRRGLYLTKSVKEVFKSKSGYSQEINLLLTTMLRHEKIDAHPVILSTTDNGHTSEVYPLINKFNYVICKATIHGLDFYLDASQPYLGFGKLPGYAYNGHSRVVNKSMTAIQFSPDTLKETRISSVLLFNDANKPGRWTGNYTINYGYNESGNIRQFVLEKGKQGFEDALKENYKEEFAIDEISYEELDNKNSPVKIHYNLKVDQGESPDIIYFNPMISAGYSENPFKAENRKYPVEMPSLTDRIYLLKIEIPAGYVVDELPKSEKVTFNEDEGMFEYLVSKSATDISFRSRIKLDKATFPPEDYEYLRGFYDYIVKKHAEQIVFKKKK